MYSIYHFFAKLIHERAQLTDDRNLEQLPFLTDSMFFSCHSIGIFPDRAIRLQPLPLLYRGGELLEFKDSKGYSVSSFNSTLPTGKKPIDAFIGTKIQQQMEAAGENILSLPMRDVFYLIRGREQKRTEKAHVKVCLLHGSFFETIPIQQLIQETFAQILQEGMGDQLSAAEKDRLAALLTTHQIFNRVCLIPGASVNPGFRVMAGVTVEGNILKTTQYPQIAHDTLNLILPFYSPEEEEQHLTLTQMALEDNFGEVIMKYIKHPLNGWFIVFQCPLN